MLSKVGGTSVKIIMLGAPGAVKAHKLKDSPRIWHTHISTGDIFRENIKIIRNLA